MSIKVLNTRPLPLSPLKSGDQAIELVVLGEGDPTGAQPIVVPAIDLLDAAAALGAQRCMDLNELLGQADFVSLHLPLTAESKALIGAARLAMDQVVLTPHIGSATAACRTNMVMRALNNLLTFLGGGTPPDKLPAP